MFLSFHHFLCLCFSPFSLYLIPRVVVVCLYFSLFCPHFCSLVCYALYSCLCPLYNLPYFLEKRSLLMKNTYLLAGCIFPCFDFFWGSLYLWKSCFSLCFAPLRDSFYFLIDCIFLYFAHGKDNYCFLTGYSSLCSALLMGNLCFCTDCIHLCYHLCLYLCIGAICLCFALCTCY